MLDTLARDQIREWKKDPIQFFHEALGIPKEYIWHKMHELAEAVRDNRKVVVKAGHGVSKSFSIARLALWYLYTHYPSTIITTAPTHTQVEQILWREIRDAINNASFKMPGKLTTTKLELEDKWFAFGFSTKPDQGQENATKMQGFHNEHIMIIFDEACGIIKPIWEAKEGLMTNRKAKFVAIGNPTSSTGDFIDCFSDPTYKKITISVFDTPNYQHKREMIPGLSGREFVESIRAKYGAGSNQWKCRILGEIPDISANALLSKAWVESAEKAERIEEFNFVKRFVTWDVADGGADLHVIKGWWNTTELEEVVIREKTIEEAEPHVWRLLRRIKGNSIIIDADGIGRVAVGYAELTADSKTAIIPFYGSDRNTPDENMYVNMRAYGHWKMRELFEGRLLSLLPNNETQKEELLSLELDENRRGLIAMLPKKVLRKKLSRSPNYSDAIMMMAGMIDEVEPIVKSENASDIYTIKTGLSDNSKRFMAC